MLIENLKKRLLLQNKATLTRKRNIIMNQGTCGNKITIEGKPCINFSSNDYLGLWRHEKITNLFSQAVKKYGFGSGSSAFISGYSKEHDAVEKEFAEWLDVDKAILFSSGYLANLGVISALLDRTKTVFSDKLCHSSLLDGILLSRAKHYRYKHCDLEHIKQISKLKKPDLIISESVFSMEGSIVPIKDLIKLAEMYKSGLVIDDAHGIGIFGKNGTEICGNLKINQNQFSCLTLPLGKSFNAMGAIVAGRNEVMDAVIQFSKQYRYTTAVPPAMCTAIRASLNVVNDEEWRRDKLKENVKFFISYATKKGLKIISTDETPIKPILVHDTNKVMALQSFLLSRGFYVSAIRPPTVPDNSARLRISLNCLHMQKEISLLIDHIAEGMITC